MVLASVAFAYWRGLRQISVSDILGQWVVGIGMAALYAFIGLGVAGLILLALQRQGDRGAMLKRLCLPLAVGTGYFAGVIGPIIAFSWFSHHVRMEGFPAVLLGLVITAATVVWMGAAIRATLLAGRHYFRAEEVHPALLSLCLACVGGWALLVGIWNLLRHGANPAYPPWVAFLLGLAGPVLILGLAVRDLVRQNAIGDLRGSTVSVVEPPVLEIADAD